MAIHTDLPLPVEKGEVDASAGSFMVAKTRSSWGGQQEANLRGCRASRNHGSIAPLPLLESQTLTFSVRGS